MDECNGDQVSYYMAGQLETETIPEFVNYADFADCVLDIFQEVQGKVGAAVTYKANNFNQIVINEAFDM